MSQASGSEAGDATSVAAGDGRGDEELAVDFRCGGRGGCVVPRETLVCFNPSCSYNYHTHGNTHAHTPPPPPPQKPKARQAPQEAQPHDDLQRRAVRHAALQEPDVAGAGGDTGGARDGIRGAVDADREEIRVGLFFWGGALVGCLVGWLVQRRCVLACVFCCLYRFPHSLSPPPQPNRLFSFPGTCTTAPPWRAPPTASSCQGCASTFSKSAACRSTAASRSARQSPSRAPSRNCTRTSTCWSSGTT
jgi:hypothetical protein